MITMTRLIGLVLLAGTAYIVFVHALQVQDKLIPPAPAKLAKQEPPVATKPYEQAPEIAVNTSNIEWSRGGFGAVAVANITIRNDNAYGVKDIGLKVFI